MAFRTGKELEEWLELPKDPSKLKYPEGREMSEPVPFKKSNPAVFKKAVAESIAKYEDDYIKAVKAKDGELAALEREGSFTPPKKAPRAKMSAAEYETQLLRHEEPTSPPPNVTPEQRRVGEERDKRRYPKKQQQRPAGWPRFSPLELPEVVRLTEEQLNIAREVARTAIAREVDGQQTAAQRNNTLMYFWELIIDARITDPTVLEEMKAWVEHFMMLYRTSAQAALHARSHTEDSPQRPRWWSVSTGLENKDNTLSRAVRQMLQFGYRPTGNLDEKRAELAWEILPYLLDDEAEFVEAQTISPATAVEADSGEAQTLSPATSVEQPAKRKRADSPLSESDHPAKKSKSGRTIKMTPKAQEAEQERSEQSRSASIPVASSSVRDEPLV